MPRSRLCLSLHGSALRRLAALGSPSQHPSQGKYTSLLGAPATKLSHVTTPEWITVATATEVTAWGLPDQASGMHEAGLRGGDYSLHSPKSTYLLRRLPPILSAHCQRQRSSLGPRWNEKARTQLAQPFVPQ